MADIPIEYSEFCICIEEIQRLSDDISDGWRVVNDAKGVYLTKEIERISKHKYSAVSDVHLEDVDYVESDDCATSNATTGQLTRWEIHVVYNLSYGVPMLCFNVWDCTGRLLNLSEIWTEVERNCNAADMLTTLTQMDHPVLQTPFFVFHPCKTSEILTHFRTESTNVVLSWLSVMAPIVFIDLSLWYSYSLRKNRRKEITFANLSLE